MKKIRLTERNLQRLVQKVIKETQLLKEGKIEVWCECGDQEGCYGSYDGGEECDCTCCDPLINPDSAMFGPGAFMQMENKRLRRSRR
jgi:hypothetical protein